ncbi:MAG: CBS domain-containing protein [Thermodesulfovibrionia bacterium]
MLKAKDIMTRDVITIRPDATVEELARLLIEHKISGVPVIDESDRLIGIVTENDLIRQNKRLHIPTIIRLFDAYIVLGSGRMEDEIKRMVATTVGEICTRDVITVNEDATIEEIATIMSERNVHLIPVLKDGRLVGIIGKADVVGAMTGEANKQ